MTKVELKAICDSRGLDKRTIMYRRKDEAWTFHPFGRAELPIVPIPAIAFIGVNDEDGRAWFDGTKASGEFLGLDGKESEISKPGFSGSYL